MSDLDLYLSEVFDINVGFITTNDGRFQLQAKTYRETSRPQLQCSAPAAILVKETGNHIQIYFFHFNIVKYSLCSSFLLPKMIDRIIDTHLNAVKLYSYFH